MLFGFRYDVLEDTSEWRTNRDNFSIDLIGGMTPDIVIRDIRDEKNPKIRIIIEVKHLAELNYDIEDSQLIRYFLYLLCSTNKKDSDIKRGLFLAAPQEWFNNQAKKEKYEYFLNTYKKIADKFDIEIGRILIENIVL